MVNPSDPSSWIGSMLIGVKADFTGAFTDVVLVISSILLLLLVICAGFCIVDLIRGSGGIYYSHQKSPDADRELGGTSHDGRNLDV